MVTEDKDFNMDSGLCRATDKDMSLGSRSDVDIIMAPGGSKGQLAIQINLAQAVASCLLLLSLFNSHLETHRLELYEYSF